MQIKLQNGENTIKIYVSDVRNVVVEITRINSKGKPEKKKGFYRDLEHALKYIVEDFPFISRDKTIRDLQLFMDDMKQQLWKELEGLKFPSNEEVLNARETESKEVFDDDDWDDAEIPEGSDFDEDWE